MTDSHIYHLRASSGEYDKLLVNLQNMKKHALFGLEYNVDFARHPKNGFRKLAGDEKKESFLHGCLVKLPIGAWALSTKRRATTISALTLFVSFHLHSVFGVLSFFSSTN